jgi:hypothetical protein
MKDTYILNSEANIFLEDILDKSEITFLEEGQEQDLFDIAKAKGILVKDSVDLAVFKAVYLFADIPNGNGVIVPKTELLTKLPTVIGKPITLNHIRRYTIGYIIDYRYVEKENKVIIYGIIFKSIFKLEWEKALKLFKEKKLKVSYEIWSPKSKREFLSDGKTYKLHEFEFAGCTLVMTGKPAFEEANVLETAKLVFGNEKEKELIFATLNKDNLESLKCGKECRNCEMCENLIFAEQSIPLSINPQSNQPMKLKIICSHCGQNFEQVFMSGQTSPIKCPNCFSILDQQGNMIFPPQIKNWNLSCLECQANNNWLVEESKDKEAKIKCLSCSKEYNVTFKESDTMTQYISKLMFLRQGRIRCLQCSTLNEFAVPSSQTKIGVKCNKCGLEFDFDVNLEIKRDIERIEKATIKKVEEPIKEEKKMYVLEEAKLEIEEKDLEETEKDNLGCTLEEGKKLTYEQKQNIADEDFAVVITVKNKVTGEPRKIRKYPIQDEAHVRNALARLGQEAPKAELKKLGISVDSVIQKVLARARKLGMTELIERHKMEKAEVRKLLRKACLKIKEQKKITKTKEEELEKATLKHTKFVAGIKKFANKIKEINSKSKAKDLEMATLREEIETIKIPKVEPIVEPVLETASTRIGDKTVGLGERERTIKEIRNKQDKILNPIK